MSLNRTAARLATVMALANGFAAPWPTVAQGRVFDSRTDPRQIVDVAHGDVLPMITVCTDDDKGDSLSENNGGPPFRHDVTVNIELSLGMVGEIDGRPGELGISYPTSEPALETMLDLLEFQVKRVLADPASPWSEHVRRATRRISAWTSTRYVERDSNVRLAARSIAATYELAHEELVETTISGVAPPPAAIPGALGPLLDAIVASGSSYAADAAALRDMLLDNGAAAPVTLPPLLRVRFIESEQAQTNNAGVPRGPRAPGVAQATLPTS